MPTSVKCPICGNFVTHQRINDHLDSKCVEFVLGTSHNAANLSSSPPPPSTPANGSSDKPSVMFFSQQPKRSAATFFQTPAAKRQATVSKVSPTVPTSNSTNPQGHQATGKSNSQPSNSTANTTAAASSSSSSILSRKRTFDQGPGRDLVESSGAEHEHLRDASSAALDVQPTSKRTKTARAAPLADRMRPQTLDDVHGQELVGPHGVLRALIESDRVPSMILWGGSGTGKTTIARCIAGRVGSRFVELNATSTGVAECKKLFQEASNELALTGRKTIIFCDEIHRFSRSQQDVFLRPVEAGTITLIGATTENPSFKVGAALLSRCRTFTLRKLDEDDLVAILRRTVAAEEAVGHYRPSPLVDDALLRYLAAFADGDARTALNLLELALSLTARPGITQDELKAALTKTLVYDRAGDQHYDTISAFHKSVRGSDPDAALYYLARMLQSGEDPLFIARRMVVIASEDVGLADSSLLPLATAAYTATQQLGMPEARIPLAHACVALCLAPKSTRAYRALNAAFDALREPGVASLPVPLHLRNAPTRLLREMGCGADYKYPPNYRDGRVRQEYLPEGMVGRRFLEDRHLGTEVDPDLEMQDA
ncbi:P-loop containing nucleoside triphosphate hydrolase protein [Sodiomyces alkalinus F11]|uniref:P-loop containing nucleoside triphosphate hydrolase protein n=1 Tax=Sodiomyces alkalinus (strain CBS 110278 / VKM F-3762 / F11) TaxID=1314773 RepID=A0A3N2Q143_SODAK|nr:P-loop containing nucleoside triphosphate hydrolase protein [Sodiomyces alkalinus F11]ROT40460.1 P-loop containing nucleoside triphosphate hydrolase protein [Sodiomyces alkalinus F11]